MSSHESPTNEHDRPTKRRIQRRHGACEPCRSSKTKCDGRMPCGACRSERRRQCPCVYSEKAMKLQQVTAEVRRRAESERRHMDDTAARSGSDDEARGHPYDNYHDSVSVTVGSDDAADVLSGRSEREHALADAEVDCARMIQPLSICATIEEFKRLKPARGYSAQVVSRCGGFDVANAPNYRYQPRAVDNLQHSSTAPQPAPHASIISPDFTGVLTLGARLDAVEKLVRDGCPTQAWVDLASLVREAQLVQETMTQDQSSPPSAGWRHVWNNVLELEAQLGLTIGRPVCLVSAKRRRITRKIDTVVLEDSLEDIKSDLYQHIQGLLGLNLSSDTAIRDFLERARDILHHEPFNQIGLCTTEGHSASVRDVHLNTHLLFVVIFGRMASLCDLFSRDLTNGSWTDTPAADIIRSLNLHQPRQKLAYCRKMFRSANFILDSFFGIHQSNAEHTGKSWIRCHSAFIAAIILGIAKLRHEVEWHATTEKLRRLEQMFSKLSQNHPQCQLFSTAIERLQDLNSVKEPASEAQLNKHTGVKNRKRGHPDSRSASPHLTHPQTLDPPSELNSTSPTLVTNRQREAVDQQSHESSRVREQFAPEQTHPTGGYQQLPSLDSVYDDPHLNPLSLFEDTSATWSTSSRGFATSSIGSSATSFSEPDLPVQAVSTLSLGHPGPPFAYPFPYDVFHPPMSWNNAAYVINGQTPTSLPLQIPVAPQYRPTTSPIAGDIGPQFSLSNSRNNEPLTSSSHQSSPSRAPSDVTLVGNGGSSTMTAGVRFIDPTATPVGITGDGVGSQSFLQQVKTPLLGNDLSNTSGRPSLDRRHSAETMQPSSVISQRDPQQQSIGWHPSSNVAASHEMPPNVADTDLSIPDVGQGASADNLRQTEASTSRLEQRPYYPHAANQPTANMMGHQLFPSDQVSYLQSTSELYEQSHMHGSYQQGPPSHYPKFFVQDPNQFHDQWRRMTVNTGGVTGSQF